MAKSFKAAINKTSLSEKSGISALLTSSNEEQAKPKLVNVKETKELRQSFIITSDDFEKLKDYVFMKKQSMDPLFSQKEALHLALNILFEKEKNIPPRPEAARRAETKRSIALRKK